MNNKLQFSNQESILIIDDNPDNLNLLNGILSNAGYKVHLAPSGKIALAFIESKLPQLILLDIMMPNMDGYAVCERIKSCPRTQNIPIIFISALQDITDKIKSFSLGGVDYITKPFHDQEVLIRIENQLQIQRLSQKLIDQNILEERNRIAREIHDTLAQAFTGIILLLTAAERAIPSAPEQAISHLKTSNELARYGLAAARRSVEGLRPQLLENSDLHSALQQIAAQMSSPTETQVIFEVIGTPYPLSVQVENNLLRIGQEALTNAFKYAKANLIKIQLVYESTHFLLRVQDNGQGFDSESITVKNGFGFLGMKERSERIKGQLTINSSPVNGTEITILIPLP
ncbi:MAG TPA: response regulator [Halomicronema sp.]